MKFQLIKGVDSEGFKEGFEIYEEAFPSDERRDLESQSKTFLDKDYKFYTVYLEGKVIGIITEWKFGKFNFIEHLAVKRELRNKGLGSKLMNEFFQGKEGLSIIEVERPNSEIAKRRINFYKRLGWKLNLYDYIQPPYSKEKNVVPMYIISHPREITNKEFTQIRKDIHKRVYGCKSPILKL